MQNHSVKYAYHHAMREAEQNGEVNLMHCKSEHQVADIMTKAVSKAKFEEFRFRLGVSSQPSRRSVEG